LYAHAAPAVAHQTYLLTGDRGRAFESVEHAFRQAWDNWPEITVDPDPVGRVRAHAHEYALSPRHRLRREPKRRTGTPPVDSLTAALLELPPLWRRTVLLCEGLGMSVTQAATETAAGTQAASSRLMLARVRIAEYVPELREPEELERRLGALVSTVSTVSTATLPSARSVRAGSEERMRTLTRVVFGETAALAGLIALTAVTTSAHHAPSAPKRAVTMVRPSDSPPSSAR
jgi:hypothetical protein